MTEMWENLVMLASRHEGITRAAERQQRTEDNILLTSRYLRDHQIFWEKSGTIWMSGAFP